MKKLFALILALLMTTLIFASCDTVGEEVSGEPVSEVSSVEASSVEVSSKEEQSEVSSEIVSKEPYSFVPEVLFADSWEKTELTDEWKKQVIDDAWMYRMFFILIEIKHPHNIPTQMAINYYMHHTYDDASMMGGEMEIPVKDVAAKVGEKFANVSKDWAFTYRMAQEDWELNENNSYHSNVAMFGMGGSEHRDPYIVSSEKNKDGVLKISIGWYLVEGTPLEEWDSWSIEYFDFYYVLEDGIWKIAKVIETTDEKEMVSTEKHFGNSYPADMTISFSEAEIIARKYFDKRENFPKNYLCEPNGWLEMTRADGSKSYYHGMQIYVLGGEDDNKHTCTFAWIWVDMINGGLYADFPGLGNGLPVLDWW